MDDIAEAPTVFMVQLGESLVRIEDMLGALFLALGFSVFHPFLLLFDLLLSLFPGNFGLVESAADVLLSAFDHSFAPSENETH